MLLKSGEIEINKDDPFKNDALGRKKSAEALTNFVLSAEEPLVVCIDAPWGDGKTTFLRMWEKHLKNNAIPTLYFNAWENDFSDDALVSLIGEISSSIKELSKTGNELKVTEYLDKTKKLSIALLKRVAPLATKIATAGVMDLDKVTQQALAGFAELIAKEQLEKYEHSKKSIQSFREALSSLASSMTNKDEPKPLVFIIDELDRCRPNYAIEILEKAKHFFNVDNIVFVLGVHKEQLGSSIKGIYGEGLDANGYLRRFIDFDFILPPPNKELFAKALFKKFGFREHLLQHQGKEALHEADQSLAMFSDLFEIYRLTLREQEHCCSLLSLSIRIMGENPAFYIPLLCFLIVIKINNPDLYKKLITNEIDLLGLFNQSKDVAGFADLLSADHGTKLEVYIVSCTSRKQDRDAILKKYREVGGSDSASVKDKVRASVMLEGSEIFGEMGEHKLLKSVLENIEIASRFNM